MEYGLRFLIDTFGESNRVRVRWVPSPATLGRTVETNFIISIIQEYLEDFDAVEIAFFTRYTALLDVASHIVTPNEFKKQIKTLIETDIARRIEMNSQIKLVVEVAIL